MFAKSVVYSQTRRNVPCNVGLILELELPKCNFTVCKLQSNLESLYLHRRFWRETEGQKALFFDIQVRAQRN